MVFLGLYYIVLLSNQFLKGFMSYVHGFGFYLGDMRKNPLKNLAMGLCPKFSAAVICRFASVAEWLK